MVKAVTFMYVRPPSYNAESAKAAEVVDERKRLDQNNGLHDPTNGASIAMPHTRAQEDQTSVEKKPRPKDVFGRTLPTEEEFELLKNAPRFPIWGRATGKRCGSSSLPFSPLVNTVKKNSTRISSFLVLTIISSLRFDDRYIIQRDRARETDIETAGGGFGASTARYRFRVEQPRGAAELEDECQRGRVAVACSGSSSDLELEPSRISL